MRAQHFLLCLLLLLAYQEQLYAHAVVTEHSFAITKIHANHEEQVSLDFNSKIELGLSEIFLISKGDVYTLLPISKGKKQGQILINIPALASGEYAIKLKVFAADGHLTEDVIYFSVIP
ncbi:MAG: copper resistance CopC family protein [Methylovulum sp.]|jgi:methionine-rich copper-binding protein CopC